MSHQTFRRLSRLTALIGFLLVAVPLVYLGGPTIEGHFFPIIRGTARGNPTTTPGGHICWDTTMEKARTGVPAYALYTTTLHERPVSIFVYLGKNGTPLTTPAFQNHAAGERWVTEYCTDLPEQLRARPLTIDGTLYYNLPWRPRWWLVPQPLPTLTIPADASSRNAA